MPTEIAGIGIAAAFLAGTVSFLSPCVLPLVPGYLSYMAGRSVDDIAAARAARTPDAVSILFIIPIADGFIVRRVGVPGAIHQTAVTPDGRYAIATHLDRSRIRMTTEDFMDGLTWPR